VISPEPANAEVYREGYRRFRRLYCDNFAPGGV